MMVGFRISACLIAVTPSPTGKRKYVYATASDDNQRAVMKRRDDVQRAIRDGLAVPDDRLTVAQHLDEWLHEHAAKRIRSSTLRSYETKVRPHIAPAIGRIRLARLTPKNVEKMMGDSLAKGVPARSGHHHRAVLKTALTVAMRWERLGRNVAALSEPPKVPERMVRPLSLADA